MKAPDRVRWSSITSDELRQTLRAPADAAAEWSEARSHLTRVAADCAEFRSAIAAPQRLAMALWLTRRRARSGLSSIWGRAAVDRSESPLARDAAGKPRHGGVDFGTARTRPRWQRPALLGDVAVELGPTPAGGPLSRIGMDGACVISRRRVGGGWELSMRQTLVDGKLGDCVAELLA